MIESVVGLLSGVSIVELGVGVGGSMFLLWYFARQFIGWLKRRILMLGLRNGVLLGIGLSGISAEMILPDGVLGAIEMIRTLIG